MLEQEMVYVDADAYIFRVRHRIMEGDCQMDHGPRLCAVPPLWADRYAVTNQMYFDFIAESGYAPAHSRNFLKHWRNGRCLPGEEDLPVVHISQDDAKAYAAFYGKRLPSETEWQYLAAGPEKLRWPWGGEKDYRKCNVHGADPEKVNSRPEGVSPFGLYHMCGNVWEFTAERYYDAITGGGTGPGGAEADHCFITLRGGSFYTGSHYWHTESGAVPNDAHLKMHLLGDAMDRLETVGFRCVKDEPGR
ncbi:MAG: formylglycine-generating enzyme family protein [Spirochaetaceae bacterium]|jgi:formylglycine-generating enzyme required for sulfatase activity|nr:formylglycine-generating enzyme family protein [Spirochaetaceae bacterium]